MILWSSKVKHLIGFINDKRFNSYFWDYNFVVLLNRKPEQTLITWSADVHIFSYLHVQRKPVVLPGNLSILFNVLLFCFLGS